MKNTVLHSLSVLIIVLFFTACDKESKKFEKETLALSGHYTLEHYTLQEYNDAHELVTNISSDTSTAVIDLTHTQSAGYEYSLLNEFRFTASIPLRMLAPIRNKVPLQQNEDGSESSNWRPDATENRLLVFYNQVVGAEYVILTIEDLGKNRRRWTYIESFDGFDGFDGGNQSSLKLKEVFELKRED